MRNNSVNARTGNRCTKSQITNIDENWESLRVAFNTVAFMSCKPDETFKKVKTGEVLDEEKSVRWNREEVERLKKCYQDEVARLNSLKNSEFQKVTKRAECLVQKETGLNEGKAKLLWNYIYVRYHSTDDLWIYAEEICELVKELLA